MQATQKGWKKADWGQGKGCFEKNLRDYTKRGNGRKKGAGTP